MTEFVWHSKVLDHNSCDLRYAIGCRAKSVPESFLLLLHGRGEYLEKYQHLADDFKIPEGVGVLALDLRGQGGCGGTPGHVDDYREYAEDINRVVSLECGDKPYHCVAHSTGGLAALVGIGDGLLKPECLVLSSPLLGLPKVPLMKPLLSVLSFVCGREWPIPRDGQSSVFEGNPFTSNKEVFDDRIKNSLFHSPLPTVGWVKSTQDAIAKVFSANYLKDYTVPTLLLSGSDERIIDGNAAILWSDNQKAYNSCVSLVTIDQGRHELLVEGPGVYEKVLDEIFGFWKKHLSIHRAS